MRNLILASVLVAALAGAAAAAPEAGAPTLFQDISMSYLKIQTALAGDSIDGVAAAAQAIGASASAGDELDAAGLGVAADKVDAARALLPKIAASAGAMAAAKDVKAAREAFVGLSEGVVALRDIAVGERPVVAYCPMAKHEWLQAAGAVANPYYGSGMLRCGSIVRK
ncbi:MAG TPA: DUF3347 domain-containing protein [Candidatus Krumholzibacteria bacterium]|nr:DUF3347 domain-containing protein [Candidatus Krumholzibacteria bacterium]